MRELTAEDFKRGVRNPFFHKLNKEVQTFVRHEDYKIFAQIAEQNGVTPEIIMNRCLTDYAKRLQEAD
ncbi:MAG: hypothetical protein FWG90_13005 [Oscillospiraceae bacterium]|nr:hypothetical protein [Oscillospiraceae bacterium]